MKQPPQIKLKKIRQRLVGETGEFLKVDRSWYAAEYTDGSKSEEFSYDVLERKYTDAVAIVAYSISFKGCKSPDVYLRSCLRPPLLQIGHENQWELAAGLIDPGETAKEAAVRECEEELGFSGSIFSFNQLGNYIIPVGAVFPEKIYFYSVEIKPDAISNPTLDGSPLERGGEVLKISLADALYEIRHGKMFDAKTEIGLRRLEDKMYGVEH